MQAVTFDLWGTLFTERDHQRVGEIIARTVQEVLEREGWRIDHDQLTSAMRQCRRLVMSWQVDEGLDFPPRDQLIWILGRVGIAPPGWLLEQLEEVYTTTHGLEAVELVPGAPEVLRTVSRHGPVGLICNTGRTPGRVLRNWFQTLDLQRFFQTLVFSDEIGLAKPNPELFHLVLDRLGVAPGETAHVGDDLRTDIEGARRAGVVPIWLNRHGKSGCPEGVRELNSLADLPAALGWE